MSKSQNGSLWFHFLFLFFVLTVGQDALSAPVREEIGELRIHDLLLRPEFLLNEPGDGSFSIGESSFALRWELEETYQGVIRLGSRKLLNPPARYISTVEDDIVLIEAYGQLNHVYGRVRLGRIPVEFGYEGQQWERNLIFPRSLLFQKRVTPLRDLGISYEISQGDFFTGIVAHNGEGDTEQDGRAWYTGRWGYRRDSFEIGVVGQTGSTKPIATSTSGDTLAGVDPTLEAKWRMGGIYGALHRQKWQMVVEAYGGEREQETRVGKFATGHSDLSHEFSRLFSAHLRYDHFDPNLKITGDLVRQASLALMFSNKTHSSNLILVGTKVFEEIKQEANDELRLIWSLSPSAVVRF